MKQWRSQFLGDQRCWDNCIIYMFNNWLILGCGFLDSLLLKVPWYLILLNHVFDNLLKLCHFFIGFLTMALGFVKVVDMFGMEFVNTGQNFMDLGIINGRICP